MKVSLGFDTSCYTTSVAAVNEEGQVLSSSRLLLPVAMGERGLRQSEAVFVHVKQLPIVAEKTLQAVRASGGEIACICVSKTPRPDESSYMPVFTVGHGHAKVLADALCVPLYTTSHQQGHIAAGMVGNTSLNGDMLSFHISGGTTEMLLSCGEKLTLVGGTLDLHAGQLVDRVGVAMGLSFPAGPALEQLALQAKDPAKACLGVSLAQKDCYCHLSGAETKALQWLREEKISREALALEVFDFLARTLTRMIVAGTEQYHMEQVLIVGGVASSMLLRKLIRERLKKVTRKKIDLRFGEPQYSADNAVGVARIGMIQYQNKNDLE